MSTKQIGDRGEQLALEHLTANGYKILARNWQWQHKEIDIIAQKGDFIVFVEVKTRRTNVFGEPFTFVSRQKRKNISRAAHQYITQNDIDAEARFDIISILYNTEAYELEHIEDAFYGEV